MTNENKVRFIQCSTEDFNTAIKDNNALYFIISGDLEGALYKGSLLIGRDFTAELEALVDIVEDLVNAGVGGGLTWGEF